MSSKNSSESISRSEAVSIVAEDMLKLVEIIERQDRQIRKQSNRMFLAFCAIATQAVYLLIFL